MSKKFLTPIGLPTGVTNPSVGRTGDLFFRTDESKVYIYTGTIWEPLQGGGGSYTISDTPPLNPMAGDVWFNSVEGATYIYYDSYWIEPVKNDAGPTGPQGSVGPTGPAVTGPTGAQGPVGATGAASTVTGPTGAQGPQGTDIHFIGSVATVGALPSTGNSNNDAYIVDSDGNLYVWNGSSWTDAGQIVGPQGPTGAQGVQGVTGPTGPAGADGIIGVDGATGPTGQTGSTGPTGAAGAPYGNIDGGTPSSIYGGISPLDGGNVGSF